MSLFSEALQRQNGHHARSPSISGLTNFVSSRRRYSDLRSRIQEIRDSNPIQDSFGSLQQFCKAAISICRYPNAQLHSKLSPVRNDALTHSAVAARYCKHLMLDRCCRNSPTPPPVLEPLPRPSTRQSPCG